MPRRLPATRANYAACSSVNPRLGLDVLNVVGECELVDRAIVDPDGAALPAPTIEPGDGVLHPVLVVTLWIIFLHVRAPALLAVGGAMHRHHRLGEQIVELERLDQVAIPDEAAVGNVDVGHAGVDLVD